MDINNRRKAEKAIKENINNNEFWRQVFSLIKKPKPKWMPRRIYIVLFKVVFKFFFR